MNDKVVSSGVLGGRKKMECVRGDVGGQGRLTSWLVAFFNISTPFSCGDLFTFLVRNIDATLVEWCVDNRWRCWAV